MNSQSKEQLKGCIFDIKKYAIHDGPGIRTTVFFKGCPLRCKWCHNPESWNPSPELWHRSGRCTRCGRCVCVCQQGAISLTENGAATNAARCILCGRCVDACLTGAREIVGREMTVQAVMDELTKDIIFYDESGGGVTFSGGEPLMQPEFLMALLDRCRSLGIHTAVDTTCYAAPAIVGEVAAKTDLFLCDVKHTDPDLHREFTGEDNKLILENVRLLADMGKKIIIRIPIIGGFNDDRDNIEATGEFVASLGNVGRIDLLPYNAGGLEKTKRLISDFDSFKAEVPDSRTLRTIADILGSRGFEVKTGG